jgi:hypothetical protein
MSLWKYVSSHEHRSPLTLDSSYKSLTPKTRATVGLALIFNAAGMLLFSDQIEAALGLTPAAEDKQAAFKMYTVEREKK